MGIALKDLIVGKEIKVDDLKDKILVVDSFNMLYQFLTTIRSYDGTPLMDSKGNITSHLTGLFSRVTNFMKRGLKLVFIFDGEPPELKKKERERRHELKQEAKREYEVAKQREDVEGMKKYAGRTASLTPEMVEEAKKLITALGLPVVQAPSEGEAQAAYMVRKGDAYAAISQDFDTLAFGCPRLVRNLNTAGRRKRPGSMAYVTVYPEIITLQDVQNELGIDQEQIIAMGMLVGTDFNIGGIKGIGPKKAVKLVQDYDHKFDELFSHVQWDENFEISYKDVFELFHNLPHTDDYTISFKEIDRDAVVKLLCDEHDFAHDRIEKSLDELEGVNKQRQQKGLGDFM